MLFKMDINVMWSSVWKDHLAKNASNRFWCGNCLEEKLSNSCIPMSIESPILRVIMDPWQERMGLFMGTSIYLKRLWNDLIKGLPYQGCFVIWSNLKEIFSRMIPLQIWGCITAAWRPTTPVNIFSI